MALTAEPLSPPNRSSSGKPVGTVKLSQLYRLLKEYTKRLTDKTNSLAKAHRVISLRPNDSETKESDLTQDVHYLARQTVRLVNKASVYRESNSLEEADNIELELYLFDAENALRTARAVLSKKGIDF